MTEAEYFGDWYPLIDKQSLNRVLNRLITETDFTPPHEDVFKVFTKCSFSNLKAVFLGMDPYPQKGVATGVAFANKKDVPLTEMSPSLKVIFNSVGAYYSDVPDGTLDCTLDLWSRQGILLLNSALTTKIDSPGSHALLWRRFIASLLSNISKNKPDTVFVLFGQQAQSFSSYISNSPCIRCVHPSYCARKGILLPDIFSEIDALLAKSDTYIYWM